MTDISFSTPAKLLAFDGQQGGEAGFRDSSVDEGTLGRLVGIVMAAEPAERWRYAIQTGEQSRLRAEQIATLAGSRSYADWHAGQL
ncbi:hypothetical protein [Novosphingobium rosa]|uniref:hypothetical protein n=1 Tax=Novosphingobium rosa TaxID=76978 RepID=UPI0012EED2FB|nr:hypothetical protein [Novosphingobium rosa]